MTSGPGFVGLYTLRRAVVALGSRALPPKSTALGRALHEPECSPLLRDLGLERRAKVAMWRELTRWRPSGRRAS